MSCPILFSDGNTDFLLSTLPGDESCSNEQQKSFTEKVDAPGTSPSTLSAKTEPVSSSRESFKEEREVDFIPVTHIHPNEMSGNDESEPSPSLDSQDKLEQTRKVMFSPATHSRFIKVWVHPTPPTYIWVNCNK